MHKGSYYDSVLAIEMKKNSESFFNYDTNLTSVLLWNSSFFFFFVMLASLYGVISFDVINVENVHQILRYFF